jgi:hypothetical protein
MTTEALDLFAEARAKFEQASGQAGGTQDYFYNLGDYRVCLRFAGPALAPYFTPALAHLAVAPVAQPHLTVCLWDSATTQVSPPTAPLTTGGFTQRGEIVGYHAERVQVRVQFAPDILNVLDLETNEGVYWIRAAAQVPAYETGSPLLAILNWWMSRHGRQLAHAGVVGSQSQGVMLVGKGGSGKSTTSLACVAAGFTYVSDDYCLLRAEPPYAYSLFNSGKLDSASIARLPHFESAAQKIRRAEDDKTIYFLHQLWPARVSTGLPLKAILLPRVTGQPATRLRPATPAAALTALAPSTLFQLAGGGQTEFQTLARLVRQLPCYHLDLGTQLSDIVQVIESLM